jgi:hypothetical protein
MLLYIIQVLLLTLVTLKTIMFEIYPSVLNIVGGMNCYRLFSVNVNHNVMVQCTGMFLSIQPDVMMREISDMK